MTETKCVVAESCNFQVMKSCFFASIIGFLPHHLINITDTSHIMLFVGGWKYYINLLLFYWNKRRGLWLKTRCKRNDMKEQKCNIIKLYVSDMSYCQCKFLYSMMVTKSIMVSIIYCRYNFLELTLSSWVEVILFEKPISFPRNSLLLSKILNLILITIAWTKDHSIVALK